MPSNPPALRHDSSRNAVLNRLWDLLAQVAALPIDPRNPRSYKLQLEVLKEIAAIGGFHHSTSSSSNAVNVSVHFPWLEKKNIDLPAETIDLPAIPPAPPVHYTLAELIHPAPDQEASPPSLSMEDDPHDPHVPSDSGKQEEEGG